MCFDVFYHRLKSRNLFVVCGQMQALSVPQRFLSDGNACLRLHQITAHSHTSELRRDIEVSSHTSIRLQERRRAAYGALSGIADFPTINRRRSMSNRRCGENQKKTNFHHSCLDATNLIETFEIIGTIKYGMFRYVLSLIVAITALSSSIVAQNDTLETKKISKWEIAAKERHDELIRANGPGTDMVLRDHLRKMGEEDQASRGFAHGRQTSAMTKELIQQLPATDARLTLNLKQIVKERGWPTIALVGIDASNAAMLILTHTTDHAWQRQLLPQLQALADDGKIDPSPLALVLDKELVAEGKLQRYGSQFKFINGEMAMYAVEDPANLDQRRAKALLPPMDVYKETLAQIYHLKVADAVVTAISSTPK